MKFSSNVFFNLIKITWLFTIISKILLSLIYREFLAPGAPCEINIDGKTMEKTHQEMKNPSRFTFDSAAEHVYTLLLKKDCYPRFIRSDHYRKKGISPVTFRSFFY